MKKNSTTTLSFDVATFFKEHRLFRTEQFVRAHTASGASPATSAALLRYYLRRNRLILIRRGLYAHPDFANSVLIAAHLAPDAVVAYGAALFHWDLTRALIPMAYFTSTRASPFVWDDWPYLPVRPSKAQLAARRSTVITAEHKGVEIRVTSKERTLVDALDRVDLCDLGAMGFLRVVQLAGPLDVDAMIHYCARLENRLCAGRLGVILFGLDLATNAQLARLEALSPHSPCYFDRRHREPGDGLVSRFRVLVPPGFPVPHLSPWG